MPEVEPWKYGLLWKVEAETHVSGEQVEDLVGDMKLTAQTSQSTDGVTYFTHSADSDVMHQVSGKEITLGLRYTIAVWVKWSEKDGVPRSLFRGSDDSYVMANENGNLGFWSDR